MCKMAGTSILKIDTRKPDGESIDKAVSSLRKGCIIAFPTDTFYALGVDSNNVVAFERLFELKRRPPLKPVILLADSLNMVREYVSDINDHARKLFSAFLPGKLTMVFEPAPGVPSHLLSKDHKIAFRIPDSGLCIKLINQLGRPITGTSANLSGMEPSRSARDVLSYFKGKIDLILDGGELEEEKVSTIIDISVNPPKILRDGAISEKEIMEVLTR